MQQVKDFRQLGLAVINTEAEAIQALIPRINGEFNKACSYLLDCSGKIIVMGMGKSGHIGHKIAATFASTGSPAFFVNAAEASHGDMGMVTREDVILIISNSGKTEEIITILPYIKRLGVLLITLTGNQNSTLAKGADVNIDISVDNEACPFNLAPTASTTAALVMGDALAIALLQAKGFTAKDFALSHPGGILGRKLLLRVDSLMHTGDTIPKVNENMTLSETLIEMTQKKLGMTCITDSKDHLSGIFTDGDLRRVIDSNVDIHNTPIHKVMTKTCKTITTGILAAEALQMMEAYKITSLVVADKELTIIGIVHLHDILQAGVI